MPAKKLFTHDIHTVRGRIGARAVRLTVAATLLASVFAGPQAAFAWRAGFDEVAGKPLSAGVPAQTAPDIDAAAGILTDNDGRALWSRRGDERRAMASTTKMMTALLVLERGRLDDKVTVSPTASRVPYATGLVAGERRTVRELLQLMLVTSSNDAAYALGEHVGGSMPAFVKLMNERAAKLGLKNTRFANPHGLDAPGHYSTPTDLAKLARTVTEHGEYRRVTQMKKVLMPGARGRAPRWLKSTDRLLGVYAGILGGKTGYTDNAKYSFVVQATRNGVTLTAVILAAPSERGRFAQAARLLDWGFRNLAVRRVSSAGEKVADLAVADGAANVPVRTATDASAHVFAPDGPVTREATLTANVNLPVFEGQPIGEVRLMQGKRLLARVPAIAATSTVSTEETVGAVPVADYVDRTVSVRTSKLATITLPAFEPGKPVDQQIDVPTELSAPVSAGQRVGEITYSQDGRVVAKVPVVAAESVDAPGFVQSVRTALARGWLGLLGRPTVARLQLVGA